MADYDFSAFYMAKMDRRRMRLLAAFTQVIARGDAEELTTSDVLDVLPKLHARMIVGTDGGPMSQRRLADMACQQIHHELTKLQEERTKAA